MHFLQLVFNAPWDELAADYSHGDDLDTTLCQIISTAGPKEMNQPLVDLVQEQLYLGHGMQILQTICKTIYPEPGAAAPERKPATVKTPNEQIDELKAEVKEMKFKYQDTLDRLQADRARLERQMASNKGMFMNQMSGPKALTPTCSTHCTGPVKQPHAACPCSDL